MYILEAVFIWVGSWNDRTNSVWCIAKRDCHRLLSSASFIGLKALTPLRCRRFLYMDMTLFFIYQSIFLETHRQIAPRSVARKA